METDLPLIAGLVIGALSVPSVLSALSDGRAPRVSLLAIFSAIGLVAFAVMQKPGGYRIAEVPDVFFRVLGQLF